MKLKTRLTLYALIMLTIITALVGLYLIILGEFALASKMIQTSSSLCAGAALCQLEMAGLFDFWVQKYGDYGGDSERNYGPPAFMTRFVTYGAENTILYRVREALLFEKKTGFFLGFISAALSIVATWIQ